MSQDSINPRLQILVKITEINNRWFIFNNHGIPLFGPFDTKEEATENLKNLPAQFRNKHSEDIN